MRPGREGGREAGRLSFPHYGTQVSWWRTPSCPQPHPQPVSRCGPAAGAGGGRDTAPSAGCPQHGPPLPAGLGFPGVCPSSCPKAGTPPFHRLFDLEPDLLPLFQYNCRQFSSPEDCLSSPEFLDHIRKVSGPGILGEMEGFGIGESSSTFCGGGGWGKISLSFRSFPAGLGQARFGTPEHPDPYVLSLLLPATWP